MPMNLDKIFLCFKHLLKVRDDLAFALKTQSYDQLNREGEKFIRSASFLHNDLDELIKLHQFDFMEYEIEN